MIKTIFNTVIIMILLTTSSYALDNIVVVNTRTDMAETVKENFCRYNVDSSEVICPYIQSKNFDGALSTTVKTNLVLEYNSSKDITNSVTSVTQLTFDEKPTNSENVDISTLNINESGTCIIYTDSNILACDVIETVNNYGDLTSMIVENVIFSIYNTSYTINIK